MWVELRVTGQDTVTHQLLSSVLSLRTSVFTTYHMNSSQWPFQLHYPLIRLKLIQWLLYKNGFREKAKGVTENPHGRLSASLEGVQEEDKTRFE